MPDKPLWLTRLPEALDRLRQCSDPWVERGEVESLLGVGRRRAQQLLAPAAKRRVGTSMVADRGELIRHLECMAGGQTAYYEARRRERLSAHLTRARQQWIEHPRVLVEVPLTEVRRIEVHDFDGLPEGVELAPGSITVRFENPEEALRKLMALAMAIGHNQDAFEKRVSRRTE